MRIFPYIKERFTYLKILVHPPVSTKARIPLEIDIKGHFLPGVAVGYPPAAYDRDRLNAQRGFIM